MAQTGAQVSFLTMEFVDGETLGQHVRLGGALPVAEALQIARQLLLGLSAAHAAGVLHRDFKSDNVMLRADALDRVTP
jgi:serine/threonine-protein kinase